MADDAFGDPKWSHGIDGPTLRIAANPGSPLRVAAGPGTGKTFALMRRVARLLEEGTDPSRILVITFTRTGARDITGAIRGLEVDGAADVMSSTLHSQCFKILAKSSILPFTGRYARILNEFEKVVPAPGFETPSHPVNEKL